MNSKRSLRNTGELSSVRFVLRWRHLAAWLGETAGEHLHLLYQAGILPRPVPFPRLFAPMFAQRRQFRALDIGKARVELVHDIAHRLAHLFRIEAGHALPRNDAAIAIDDHDVRIVAGPGGRTQVLFFTLNR